MGPALHGYRRGWEAFFMRNEEELEARIQALTGRKPLGPVEIVTDTTEWMNIHRGQVIRMNGTDLLVMGNAHETRFGIKDQPKYWVFTAFDLDSGARRVIKTVFHEEFNVRIGIFKIHCYRSPEKEGYVLDITRNDARFMQGVNLYDERQNLVRVLDFIRGETFFNRIAGIRKSHEQYFHEDLPAILWKLRDCIDAIAYLHENDTCHGDIRNDHIIIDADTGDYRWIDFDLKQDVSDFDTWSIGNILNYAVAKGICSFHEVFRNPAVPDAVRNSLSSDDASAFYEYRIMNLRKLYPYIPDRLSELLQHFTIRPKVFYDRIRQFNEEYGEMLDTEFPSR
jgi:hypothetical protein